MIKKVHDAPHWHMLPVLKAAKEQRANLYTGLSSKEVTERMGQYGENVLQEARKRPIWKMFFSQFSELMILLLIGAAIISGIVGDLGDTIFIIVIVLLNATVGFIQEFRAERAMAALKIMSISNSQVMRNSQLEIIDSSKLVPGDIVFVEVGNIIPADIRLLEVAQLKIDESALTGESVATEKNISPINNLDAPLGDRACMSYKGTIVANGRGRGLVIATGMNTELGKIATLIGESSSGKTPLQRRLAEFGKWVSIAGVFVCILVFAIGVLRNEPLLLMFMTAVSLAVAAIPETLPAVVTISLALGAHKMVKQHALIQSLPAVETLGSVTYICSDKTGTLTQNKMHVASIYSDGVSVEADKLKERDAQAISNYSDPWGTLFNALALSNDAYVDSQGKIKGEHTETALLQTAHNLGLVKSNLEMHAARVKELPFDSTRKRMTTFHKLNGGILAFTKGSPETVLAQCVNMVRSSGIEPIHQADLLAQAEAMASNGLRVLAFAYRSWDLLPPSNEPGDLEQGLIFLGLVGLIDPPRPEAKAAIALCQSAGITPVMITGDHPATARAIAHQLGILSPNNDHVITGSELANLDEKTFDSEVESLRVYARVDPAQKIRIVSALQSKGEIVAMTGDGVNDAPALKAADIGIAMGRSGTDVAREASRMVLLDDNFATIVHAVRFGRLLYDNVRKFVRYAITTNFAEVLIIFLAPFLGLPIPLLPTQILWINLITDGLPALALTAEPAEKGIMKRPPRPPRESLFANGMWQHILWVGLLMAGITLLIQGWAFHTGSSHWQTMTFTAITISQLSHVLAIRSEKESIFSIGIFSNPLLILAVIATFILQMATIYVPALNQILKTEPLSLNELAICIGLSSIVFIAVEIEKWLVRRNWIYHSKSNNLVNTH